MKLIHINEAVFNRLLEDNRRPPFQDFYDSIIAFVDGIRRDPIGTVPNELLKGCGLHNGELRKKLYDFLSHVVHHPVGQLTALHGGEAVGDDLQGIGDRDAAALTSQVNCHDSCHNPCFQAAKILFLSKFPLSRIREFEIIF